VRVKIIKGFQNSLLGELVDKYDRKVY